MASSRMLLPPLSVAAWMAEQEGRQPNAAAERHAQWVRQFEALLAELAAEVCDAWPPADGHQQDAYGNRVWTCLEQHWRRLAETGRVSFDEILARFKSGDIGIPVGAGSLLAEVMLAQALEFKQSKAAVMFDTRYMPDVRRIAQRAGGERAVEAVENLAADSILPRESAAARQLAAAHRQLPGTHCAARAGCGPWSCTARPARAAARRPHRCPSTCRSPIRRAAEPRGTSECEDLLKPVFSAAVSALPAEDRLMVKMLTLDGVPQHALAATLGIHSGNVTRRRKRALEQVLGHVTAAGRASQAQLRFQECLQSVLTGGDRTLQQSLAAVLAEALQPGGKSVGPGVVTPWKTRTITNRSCSSACSPGPRAPPPAEHVDDRVAGAVRAKRLAGGRAPAGDRASGRLRRLSPGGERIGETGADERRARGDHSAGAFRAPYAGRSLCHAGRWRPACWWR